jgi:O-antigen ligase/GT2 family glycosyltransferase
VSALAAPAARLPSAAAWLVVPVVVLAAGYAAGTGRGLPLLIAAGGAVAGVAILLAPGRAALALLVVLPFCVYPVSTGGLSVFLALPAALAIAVGIALLAPGVRGPLGLPVVAYSVLAGVAAIAALRSADLGTAGSRVVYLVAFGLFAWALAVALRTGLLTPQQIVGALVAGLTLAAIALIAQFVHGVVAGREEATRWLADVFPAFGGQRSAANQSSNWWIPRLALMRGVFPFMAAPSAGLAMAFGVLGAVWLRRDRRRAGAPAGLVTLALVLCTVALAFTFSRQAWFAVLVGLLVLSRGRARAAVVAPLALLLVLLAAVNVPGRGITFGSYLLSSADTGTESTGTRLGLWEAALDHIADRPLLGIGPGRYGELNPFPETAPIYYAHNVVLDMAVEAGIVAAAALVVLFLVAIAGAWRRGAELSAALLAAYLVAGMVDDVLYFPRNGFLLATAFALGVVATTARERPAPARSRPRRLPPDRAATTTPRRLDHPPPRRERTARISAVIATRNRTTLLDDTLATLAAQDVPAGALDVVVVDDGGEADLAPIVEARTTERVPVRLVRQAHGGLSVARDRGVAESNGEIVAFLDDDVLVSPGWAAAVLDAFERSDVAAVAGKIDLRCEAPVPRWLTRPRLRYVGHLDLGPDPRRLAPGETPFGGNCAVLRSFHARVGGFSAALGRTGEGLISNEEIDFFRRVREHGGRLAWEPEAHLLHRVPADRLTEGWFLRRAYAQGVSDELMRRAPRGPERPARVARELVRMGRAVPIMARRLLEGRAPVDARLWLAYCRGRIAAIRDRAATA